MQQVIELNEFTGSIHNLARKAKAGKSFVVTEGAQPLFQIGPIEDEWESLEDYEHPDRIKDSYLNAIKQYPPREV